MNSISRQYGNAIYPLITQSIPHSQIAKIIEVVSIVFLTAITTIFLYPIISDLYYQVKIKYFCPPKPVYCDSKQPRHFNPNGYISSTVGSIGQTHQTTPTAPIELRFYDKGKKYYELTNFYENWNPDPLKNGNLTFTGVGNLTFTGVMYNNILFKTSEHAFQHAKFNYNNPQAQNVATSILNALTASEAFSIAQKNTSLMRPRWHNMKDEIMLDILHSKFSDPHLSNVLKKTNTRKLIEASPIDSYWGEGKDGKGLNKLGQLLEQVRLERFGIPTTFNNGQGFF